ncbi:MAG TPA: fumarylacetoacetate hydrolase family protein [Candidatus Acidoferrales bacterium]|jgi:2-keto-4-pentenoate hydratase/2-oxohepta-3-ene-1,7-dioic acid hydratase in catechol pathway|nr:fumarylacetoacetate hydrolase family protein [Candidatus Acidoferrales bacterium]HVC23631.1 fumarylacetoacetate hydrolase family protein [Candidatus Dormibacteraeota bacterium]
MRLATITTAAGSRLHVRGRSGYVDAAAETGSPELATLAGALRAGPPAFEALRVLEARDGRQPQESEFAAAVPAPPRILCLGVNYSEHALETGRSVPKWPECFVRGTASVVGPYADLVRPALTERFDYEGELGIVIGRGGRYIPAERALEAVAGFVVCNDASARDWQRAGTQWTPGKNFDGTMPLGPELVTVDEVDVADVQLTTSVNGEVRQSARTSQMLVDVPRAVEFFSTFTTLQPGDVIATGTPGGVGMGHQPPLWLVPGDVVEVTVEGVGTIRNRVVAEDPKNVLGTWVPAIASGRDL